MISFVPTAKMSSAKVELSPITILFDKETVKNNKSEFHFLPPVYAFVTLITPYNIKSSRLPILKTLKYFFFGYMSVGKGVR